MPEEHNERGERAAHGERGDFDDFDDEEFGDYGEPDDFDDLDDDDDDDGPGPHWPAPGFPPGAPGEPPGGWHRGGPWGGGAARRGWLLALTAVVAAAFGFGVVVVALHEAAGPASAGAAPSSSATASPGAVPPKSGTSGAGNGTQPAPQGGGLPSLPPGAMERLEIGGQVTAVSATSITLNGGGQEITATVTRATKVTGKVTSISGVKVGDFVSASISGANGKLTAGSIQDPASLPSGSGQ
jgi:hypothetical protein